MEVGGHWLTFYKGLPLCQNWSRKWQPTPVFLLGESHGQRSLVHGITKSLTKLSS